MVFFHRHTVWSIQTECEKKNETIYSFVNKSRCDWKTTIWKIHKLAHLLLNRSSLRYIPFIFFCFWKFWMEYGLAYWIDDLILFKHFSITPLSAGLPVTSLTIFQLAWHIDICCTLPFVWLRRFLRLYCRYIQRSAFYDHFYQCQIRMKENLFVLNLRRENWRMGGLSLSVYSCSKMALRWIPKEWTVLHGVDDYIHTWHACIKCYVYKCLILSFAVTSYIFIYIANMQPYRYVFRHAHFESHWTITQNSAVSLFFWRKY